MIIYPAIDILDGKCVRLRQGKYDDVTVYSDNPAEFAALWTAKGARYIHVVDLNGARTGKPVNDEILKAVVNGAGSPVQVGGGIRDLKRVESLIGIGVSRVILGTGAVKQPGFVREAIDYYGDRIVIGIDAKDGYVATDGWETKSSRKALEFAKEMESIGAANIIYTDIARDGMLTGPNLPAMKEMASSVSCGIIASGGVGCLEDITALAGTGVSGVITGKALYEKKIDLSEANRILENLVNSEED